MEKQSAYIDFEGEGKQIIKTTDSNVPIEKKITINEVKISRNAEFTLKFSDEKRPYEFIGEIDGTGKVALKSIGVIPKLSFDGRQEDNLIKGRIIGQPPSIISCEIEIKLDLQRFEGYYYQGGEHTMIVYFKIKGNIVKGLGWDEIGRSFWYGTVEGVGMNLDLRKYYFKAHDVGQFGKLNDGKEMNGFYHWGDFQETKGCEFKLTLKQ